MKIRTLPIGWPFPHSLPIGWPFPPIPAGWADPSDTWWRQRRYSRRFCLRYRRVSAVRRFPWQCCCFSPLPHSGSQSPGHSDLDKGKEALSKILLQNKLFFIIIVQGFIHHFFNSYFKYVQLLLRSIHFNYYFNQLCSIITSIHLLQLLIQ